MAINRKIVEELIKCKQQYDKHYLEFPFKSDLDALFKHEFDFYLTPIFSNIVPLIYKDLKINPENIIEDYFPYIVYKYQDLVKKEVFDFERNNVSIIKSVGKQILDTFLHQLMLHSRSDKKSQNEFIENHFRQHSREWLLIFKSNPLYGLEICAKLRNPVMQNTVITYMATPIKTFIQSKSWDTFESEILNFFIYPLDVTVNEYYEKWIAKESIHVKLCNEILGEHYEKAKNTLKANEIAENYKKKQEHYEKVQRKYKKLEEIKNQEENK